ncbi:MAG TPA: hypothetical protein VGC62_19495 [Pseudomonas sp.]|uniref:hypothetical protein n=1 Tax=Pseudomonas sp. TaxID=306 RepID=UPI002ED90108
MSTENHGTQNGDNSLNVGVGDFRGASLNISHNQRPTFTPEQMNIQRHPSLGGRGLKSERVSAFGVITGLASLVGLYFTLFPLSGKSGSWPPLFMFSFIIAMIAVVTVAVLRRRKFEHFLGAGYYLEMGDQGGLYVSRFMAVCPWCGSNMQLRHVGPKEGPRDDRFICERNPSQHTIDLDPTVLPEIEE